MGTFLGPRAPGKGQRCPERGYGMRHDAQLFGHLADPDGVMNVELANGWATLLLSCTRERLCCRPWRGPQVVAAPGAPIGRRTCQMSSQNKVT